MGDKYNIRYVKQRIKSLKKYYKDPTNCNYCDKIIEIGENETPSDANKKDFCSKSCASKYRWGKTGNIGPKNSRMDRKIECKECGNIFDKPRDSNNELYNVKYCSDFCRNEAGSIIDRESTIKEAKNRYKRWRSYRSTMTTQAKRYAKRAGMEEECYYCGYDFYVELCHIKAVSSFNENAKLKEVNSPDNLVYLCPNHHKEQEAGKIEINKNKN